MTTAHFFEKYKALSELIQEDNKKSDSNNSNSNKSNNTNNNKSNNTNKSNKSSSDNNQEIKTSNTNKSTNKSNNKSANNKSSEIHENHNKNLENIKKLQKELNEKLNIVFPQKQEKVNLEEENEIKPSTVVKPTNDFQYTKADKEKEIYGEKLPIEKKQLLLKKQLLGELDSNNNNIQDKASLDYDFAQFEKNKRDRDRNAKMENIRNDLRVFEDAYSNARKVLTANRSNKASIQQKLKSVYQEIKEPNDYSKPIIKNNYFNRTGTLEFGFQGKPGVPNSYFSNSLACLEANKIKNPYNIIDEKLNNFKYSKKSTYNNNYFSADKKSSLFNNDNNNLYDLPKKKSNISKKIENLNQILAADAEAVIPNENGNILSEADFVNLDDKMEDIEKKINSSKKEKYNTLYNQINFEKPKSNLMNFNKKRLELMKKEDIIKHTIINIDDHSDKKAKVEEKPVKKEYNNLLEVDFSQINGPDGAGVDEFTRNLDFAAEIGDFLGFENNNNNNNDKK